MISSALRSSTQQLANDRAAPWLRPLLLVTVLLAFSLRLVQLARQDIWWDEARNLDVALRPLLQIATAPELDIQPPLYYYLLHGWLAPGGFRVGSDPTRLAWWARFLSVIAGALLPLFTAYLARRITRPQVRDAATACAALLGALSPFWLAESQETRMYTWALVLLAGAAIALLSAELPPLPLATRPRFWRLTAFTLLSTAALATHYSTLFVLVTWYLWWGGRSIVKAPRLRRLAAPLITGLATLLLLLPLAPVALRQIPEYANPNLVVPGVAEYLTANVQGHLAGYAWDPERLAGLAPWWLWGTLVAAGVGLVVGLRARAWCRETEALILLVVWFVGGLSLYYVAVLDRGAFNVRYSAFVTPALFAFLGAGLAHLRLLWPALLLLAGAGMSAFAHADIYDARFDREDIAGVTTWLRAQTRPGDLVLVDQKYPFGFYYDRFAIDPKETPAGAESAPARYLFVDVNTLDNQLNEWAADANRVFWVQWFESDTDPRHAVPYLLGAQGTLAGEQLFQGWRVNWWEMQPPSSFVTAPHLVSLRIVIPPVESVAVSLPESGTVGEPLQVAIRWRLAQATAPGPGARRPLKARVALYDDDDNRLAQADERLLNDRHLAPSEWTPEEEPLNLYLLTPEELPPGRYSLRVLVYDADTLEPLPVIDAAGNAAGPEATLGSVTLE